MRVFAGPNGSGKSTIVNGVKSATVNRKRVDFGIYVNADDIAEDLRKKRFNFRRYDIKTTADELHAVAIASGLINADFTEAQFKGSFNLTSDKIILIAPKSDERLAQILADFLRKKLLQEKKKFSFETVFSHAGKLDIMREATQAGYKVYLYFVSTESPDINKYRVQLRVKNGGHSVDPKKIEQRYYRSLDMVYEASQLCYQAYFFDNSEDFIKGRKSLEWFAHFKLNGKGKKKWDKVNRAPEWFKKYYSAKVSKAKSGGKKEI